MNQNHPEMVMITQLPAYLTPTLSESEEVGAEIPYGVLAYFRSRLNNRMHELVLNEFAAQEREGRTTRAELARRIRRKPEQITRWLGSPGNWTLETVSDLLLGMGMEPTFSLQSLKAHKELCHSDKSHASNLSTLLRSMMIDVQTPKEVARDIENGTNKPIYYSIRMPIEYSSISSTTQMREALPAPSPTPNVLNPIEEQVHVDY
jgi:hypothetical protein